LFLANRAFSNHSLGLPINVLSALLVMLCEEDVQFLLLQARVDYECHIRQDQYHSGI
jgi:hypothetical protein